jgi:HSP20 family protein
VPGNFLEFQMTILHYHPWAHAGRMHCGADSDTAATQWAPRVDIVEEDNRFVIRADIPGVDPSSIELSMDKGVLAIKGERKAEAGADNGKIKRAERLHGAFTRSFTLPDSADADAISASGKHGVLEVSIPKKAQTAPRKIAVTH